MSDNKNNVVDLPSDGETAYKLNIDGLTITYVYSSPTGDCQSYSISNIATIIARYENWVDILKKVQAKIGKNCLMVNMRRDDDQYTKFKEYFKNDFLVDQPYTSTRDSYMCMFIVKTNKLRM